MSYPKLSDEKYTVKEKVIRIAPATRLEGHAQINVFLDDNGEVEDTYFQVVELRGFEEFRFRDRHAVLFNVEYRWYAWSGLDMALFFDAGNVYRHVEDINVNDLKTSYGFGFHFNSKTSLPLRIDVARSEEGTRFLVKFSNVF